MPIDNIIRKLEIIRDFDTVKESEEIINLNSGFLSDLLASQLAQGKDSKNEAVTVFGRDFYSPFTVRKKKAIGVGLGRVTSHITNYMSGAFYQNLYVKNTGGDSFVFESSVPYFNEIITRSGTVIMQLNIENLSIFKEERLTPELEQRLQQRLNGI